MAINANMLNFQGTQNPTMGGFIDPSQMTDRYKVDFGSPNGSTTGIGLEGWMNIGSKGLGALSELFQGWNSMNANKLLQEQLSLGKEQFSFAKDMAGKNYSNQLKAFNNALEDRARNRAFMEGRSEQSARDYVEQHKLTGA